MAEIRSDATDSGATDTNTPAKVKAGLYIVATPIGNLGDISTRAIETLKRVDAIACEDTRVTAKLLNAFLIKKPMMAYHEHNGAAQRPKLIDMIRSGKSVALVSDAGTPLISDPGFKLVDEVADAGLFITTLPGPAAVIAALTLAGLPTDRFLFMGFAPHKSKARKDWFEKEKNTNATLVYYESARRIKDSLADLLTVLGDRNVAVCREITKKFEEVVRDKSSAAIQRYEELGAPKGELVVVVEAATIEEKTTEEATVSKDTLLETALKHMSVKSAAAFVADLTGARKSEIYTKALSFRQDDNTG